MNKTVEQITLACYEEYAKERERHDASFKPEAWSELRPDERKAWEAATRQVIAELAVMGLERPLALLPVVDAMSLKESP